MSRFPRPFILVLVALAVACMCLPAQAAGQPRGPGGGPGFGGMMGQGGPALLEVAGNAAVQTKLGLGEDQKAAVAKLAEDARARRGRGPGGFGEMTPEEREAAFKKLSAEREAAQKETAKGLKDLLGAKYGQLEEIRAGLVLREVGPTAVLDPSISLLLNISDEQKPQIQKVIDKYNEDRGKLFEGFRGGPRGGVGGPSASPQVIFVAAPGGGPGGPDMQGIRAKMDELRKVANKAIGDILTKDQKDKITALMDAVKDIQLERGRRGGGMGRGGQGGGPGGGPPGGQP